MKKNRTLTILISLFMLAFNVSLVFAAPKLSLHIVVEETIAGGSEAFIASGSAVPGLICASGDVVEVGGTTPNSSGGPIETFWVTKQFDCGGDNTFDVEMFVRLNTTTGYTKAKWNIVSGTGVYQNLQGKGKLVGTPSTTPGDIIDVYDGKVF